MNEKSYPLAWPVGWRRCQVRTAARFGKKSPTGGMLAVTVAESVERIFHELEIMGIALDTLTVSTNIEPTIHGRISQNRMASTDPGAAVYWVAKTGQGKQARCMAVDRYDTVAGNLAAIAATLGAMRSIERHGSAEILDRAFTGFVALAAPEQWFQVLGVDSHATKADINTAYKRLASDHHPDKTGETDGEQMSRINRARDIGLELLE